MSSEPQAESSQVPQTPLFPRIEEEVAAYWKKEKIFERSISERPIEKTYVFYDGPPFATGLPHYGHLLHSSTKDAVPRYWTMQGYRVPRKWGWDCHGLPIENLIEKELHLGSKKAIEAYGIDKFNDACRKAIFTYEHDWEQYIERLGRWVEFQGSYKTMDNDYIESVWWVFSELYKKGLIYKDRRTSLYCSRCSTTLSNFEIAMGNSYKDAEDPAIFIKFKVVGEGKLYFLAWTTTPWTMPANTGLSVHPELTYVAVKEKASGDTFIVAEARKEKVFEGRDVEVVKTWKGSELVGMRYEPLYSFIPLEGDGFRVVPGLHVTAEDGTGIVHTAPAFGEDDLRMAQEFSLPIAETVDEEGKMNAEMGPFAGLPIKEADPLVIEDLRKRGLLFHDERITHSVPICWRCDTLLFYKSQPAWFVDITKLKPKMLETAEKIHWHPEHFKEGRFGKGLETAPDWNISRSRYWGSPLPVWECVECGERTIVSSCEELTRLAKPGTMPEPFDFHRPIIDNVIIPCAKCGKEQKRIPEVFDCWFESGSMPVASIHYPFENKKWFDTHAPADFITEAQDQTRGWFYTLHVLSTALFEKPAFKDVVVTGMILAEDGKKMSKKLKNYPDPWEVMTKYGSDALRYYLFSSSVLEADSLNFSERDLQTVVRGFLNMVWNVKTFYEMYAGEGAVISKPRSAHVLDRWLFSRFNALLQEVTNAMNNYSLTGATRPIRSFIEDLSTWWLRRSRERMKSDNEFEKMDALRTLREILEETAKLLAPFTPFIAEKIYLDIGGAKTSVHLEKWSKVEERVMDERLMLDMQWVRDVASKGQDARVQAKIPVRQALGKLTVAFKNPAEAERLAKFDDLLALVREELNVEEVVLEPQTSLEETWIVTLDTVITPELRRKGLRRELIRHVMSMRKESGCTPTDTIRVAVCCEGEVADVIEEGGESLRRDVRASAIERVGEAPADTKLTKDVTIGGKTYTVSIV